ncbi:hypothetical protein ppKF707_2689 [Metapseudomonas furukawaii]|nr:hypothetical protein ppKF707_2689 [Pseudomonas furukawaii]
MWLRGSICAPCGRRILVPACQRACLFLPGGWQPLANPAAARVKIAFRAWRRVILDYP